MDSASRKGSLATPLVDNRSIRRRHASAVIQSPANILMPTLGKDQYDPFLKTRVTTGGLDDQQIADIVAYLSALK